MMMIILYAHYTVCHALEIASAAAVAITDDANDDKISVNVNDKKRNR